MRVFFVVNPGSHGGAGGRRWKQTSGKLNNISIEWSHQVCSGMEDVQTLSTQANQQGYDAVVAVGGDGTINRTLNGFFDQEGRRISQARMGVVYTGTSPDFCQSYGIPLDTDEALATLAAGKTRAIGISSIQYTGAAGPTNSYFACCANIGLGASLARAANSGIRKYAGDRMGTFLSLLKVLASFRPGGYRVTIDGQENLVPSVHNISVGKTRFIASGIKVHHELAEGDRGFYVMTVAGLKPSGIPSTLSTIYSGKPIRQGSALSLQYGSVIGIEAAGGDDEVEFDGDPMGRLPCRIEMAREPLELITGTPDALRA